MQTFLPHADFTESAKVLDRQRLGKQRVENLQIMNALLLGKGWVNHPATKMWRGYEGALLEYQVAIIGEWVSRGYNDTCMDKTITVYYDNVTDLTIYWPWWLGDADFHASHRSNLLRKNPDHYNQFGWDEPNNLPYVWPV